MVYQRQSKTFPSVVVLLLLSTLLSWNNNFRRVAGLIQQDAKVPYQSHSELNDAVDVYLEYYYLQQQQQSANKEPLPAQDGSYEQIEAMYGPIELWNVGSIRDFGNLFNFKRNPLAEFVQVDLSQWDVASAIWTQDMFLGASKVDFDVSQWNVAKVEKMNGMFEGATSFQGRGLELWDVSNVRNFRNMLLRTASLQDTLDLSGWTPSRAEDLDAMFRESNFGANDESQNLCGWTQYLPSYATTNDMFSGSRCPDTRDPRLIGTDDHAENDGIVEMVMCRPCEVMPPSAGTAPKPNMPNVLFIMTDQQRFDAIRFVQDELPHYDNHFKISTPNMDRLLKGGAYFRNAYCQCAVCAPARTSLRTGCTIERTGIQHNDLAKEYHASPFFSERVKEIEGLDHVLVEKLGYVSEYFGKYHMPQSLVEARESSRAHIVQHNDFDYDTGDFFFRFDSEGGKMRSQLATFERRGEISKELEDGEQIDTYSGFPYSPIDLDSRTRHRSPTGTTLSEENGFQRYEIGQPNEMGLFSLATEYTSTYFTGDIAMRALERLKNQTSPWLLTVSFHSPHPPFIPAWQELEKYWANQKDLFVPRNMNDGHMDNSAYDTIVEDIPEYGDEGMIREWTALYYALIEEVDVQIGRLLNTLGNEANNTLVVFTSDHGEMLGAHGRREKNTFYEESSRIPLLFHFPGVIPKETVVNDLVSHLDVFATILDYVGASNLDKSDGQSLRSMIENRETSQNFDEDVVFAEWDFRKPVGDDLQELERTMDDRPSFLVRKGSYKLMMQKLASTSEFDMMFHLDTDPFETQNLLGKNAMFATDTTISKAEHMRCLLLDWMNRLDGSARYYSDPAANFGEGRGDLNEIRARQSWRQLGFWVSDTILTFGKAGWNGQGFVRNEYLYLGTRVDEQIEIMSITLTGADASYFSVDTAKISIGFRECHALKITLFASTESWKEQPLDAALILTTKELEQKIVRLHVVDHIGPGYFEQVSDSSLAPTATQETQSSLSPSTELTIPSTASPEDEAENSDTMQQDPTTVNVVNATTADGGLLDDTILQDGEVGCENDTQCASGACASKWKDIHVVHMCCVNGTKYHYEGDIFVCGNQPLFSSCFEDAMCEYKRCEYGICVVGGLIKGWK